MAIEFALVVSVLLTLVGGVLSWGFAIQRHIALIHISRDAALTGARATQEEGPEAVAAARASAALTTAGFDPDESTIATSVVTLSSGSALTVRITVPTLQLFASLGIPDTLSGTTTALLEHP